MMYQKAKEFLALHCNIELDKIKFVCEKHSLASPDGYQLKFDVTALFQVEDGFLDGDRGLHYIKCPVPYPASFYMVENTEADDYINLCHEQRANLTSRFKEIIPDFGHGWLSMEYIINNRMPVDNTFTTYEYLMGCSGTFKNIHYKKGDILKSPEHYDKDNRIDFNHVSHVRIFKLNRGDL